MSSIDEIVVVLQEALDKVGEAITSATTAESETENLIAQMESAGVQDKAAEFASLKESIDGARTQLMGGAESVKQVIEQARAGAG